MTPRLPEARRRWWRPHARLGDLAVFYVDLKPGRGSTPAAREWLDEAERDRCRRYLGDLPKRQFALCRAALRILLVERLGCSNCALRFDSGRRGKPFALVEGRPSQIGFNVSHSGDHGLIAIAPYGRLGVDIEVRRARRSMAQLIETLLTEAEQRQLADMKSSCRVARFYDLWAAKEALVKATGLGHAIDVAQLEVIDSVGRSGESRPFRDRIEFEGRWEISNLGTAAYAAALARELATPS